MMEMYMKQLTEMAQKGNDFLDEIKDYDASIVLGGIATMLDEYCKLKGLNIRDTWKNLNEVADAVHTMFND